MKNMYAKFFAMLGLLLGLSQSGWAQEIEITGKVTAAEDGSGLPGVNILIIGTTSGATTDINGSYKLKAATGATLEYRFLGYTSERRTVGAELVINVVLKEEVKALKEAVVIGYGTVKKKDLTGSVVSVGSKDFQNGFQPTTDQLIAGKAAGVQIVSNGGAPGSGSTIRIRGGTSLNASNDPLIVIDGVPVDNNGLAGSPNTLSLINPNDIENITILKDASAAAIYGSRAANGVILITTKRGGSSLLSVQYSSQNSVQQMGRFVKVLSGDEFRQFIASKGPGKAALLGPEGVNVDWQKEVLQMAYTSDNNLSIGGTIPTDFINLPYRVSAGYLTQQSVLKTGFFDRFTAGLNLNPTFFENRLRVDLSLKHSLTKNRFADAGALGAAITFDPTKRPRDPNSKYGGFFEWTEPDGSLQAIRPSNPLALLELRDDRSEVTRSIGNAQFDYRLHFFPDVRVNFNLGFDQSEANGRNNIAPTSASSFIVGGSNTPFRQRKFQYINEAYINYTKEVSSLQSRIDLTVGHSFQDFRTYLYAYPTKNSKDSIVNPADRLPSPPVNVIESYFGRLNYTFKDKYLLTATLRRDGSSRFAPDYRWGWFPSVALAWKINEEPFLKNVKEISNLKLRIGEGLTGQQDVGTDYGYFGGYSYSNPTAQYQFGDTSFYRLYRPKEFQGDLRWEKTLSYNLGLDFGIFNDRISGSFDVFYRKTSDLLNYTNIPAGSNFTNKIFANVGDMDSKGFEAALNAVLVKRDDLMWEFGVNFTHFQNEIKRISINKDSVKLEDILIGDVGDNQKVQINKVGQTPQTFWVYEQVFRNGKPVYNEYVDQNGDGKITDDDRIAYKSPVPKFLMGINTNVTYRDFSLGMVWRASYGNYIYNAVDSKGANDAAVLPAFPFLNNGPSNVLETGFLSRQVFSSYYVQNASFLRCDNISLSYNLGSRLHKSINVRFNFNIQNAILITKYTGVEPEINGGIDQNFFARPRVYALGLNIGFNYNK
jgi:TonB-linked SusC/RagA family outer membrane protein